MANEEFELDFHGLSFLELKTEGLDQIYEAFLEGYRKFLIVHGYKSGNAIKNYFKSEFARDFNKYCEKSVKIYIEKVANNPGCTRLLIKL